MKATGAATGRVRRRWPALAAACAIGLLLVPARAAWGAVCPVPSVGHPTIGAAVRDPVCTTVQLAAGTFAESVEVARDLAIAGVGSAVSAVAGHLLVSGATSDVTLSGLRVDTTGTGVAGCWPRALETVGGAEVAAGPDVDVRHTAVGDPPCRLFVDGFESSGTLAWSAAVP